MVLCSLLLAFSLGFGQTVSVAQNSTPEAMEPTTQKLWLPKPVTDGPVKLELFRQQGEGVEYSPNGSWVTYDCKHKNGYYNIHVCRPDGTGDRCLTTLDNGLPHRHAGSPTWHSSGLFIAFAAEKKAHQGGSIEAIPGFGGRSDIWVMSADGRRSWQLTNTADTRNDGVILPKFSRDGTKLSWTERIGAPKLLKRSSAFGDWVLKVGDFKITNTGPQLTNIRTFQPGKKGFYEGYGFSPDGRKLIFCSDLGERGAFTSQIYTIDAETGGNLTCLTPGRAYNEHGCYSQDGKFIMWMCNLDNKNGGTDWWIMRADGSDKRRLTHFNQPGYPESNDGPVYACLGSWARKGSQILAGAQYSLIKQEGRIFLITLTNPL